MDPAMERHLEVWREREKYEPVAKLEDTLKRAGVPIYLIQHHKAPLTRGRRIATAWEDQPDGSHDPLVRVAFRELAGQSNTLFRFLTRELGVRVRWLDAVPYETAQDQATDLRGGHLYTEWGMGGKHPLLDPEEYARFRAVHDAFGHAGIGRGFDRHGEYEAWLVHAGMYTGLGAWAMSSEYRGVNASLTVGHRVPTGEAKLIPRYLIPELRREGAFIIGKNVRDQPHVARTGRSDYVDDELWEDPVGTSPNLPPLSQPQVGDEVVVRGQRGRVEAEYDGLIDVVLHADEQYLSDLDPEEVALWTGS